MQLPQKVQQLLHEFNAAFPVPTGTPGEAHEERVRQWTIKFAQQTVARFPNDHYGVKRADENRPISKDSLAQNPDFHLYAWDLLVGAGTGNPQVSDDPEFHDLTGTGQVFEDVEPVDYLAGEETPGEPEPEPQPPQQPPSARTYNEALEAGRLCEAAYESGPGHAHIGGELLAHLLWGYLLEGRTLEAIVDEARARGASEGG